MPSLLDQQTRFAAALAGDADIAGGPMAVYRNTVSANYRNALGATYRVVQQLVGVPFFNAAADAYALRNPSTCGDLNVYGDRFGDFLEEYPHASELAYLADTARLEWAIDDASRAADVAGTPQDMLTALSAVSSDRVHAQRFRCHPSCRFLASSYPVLRIWQVHQPTFEGEIAVGFDGGIEHLLIRREAGAVVIERLSAANFAFLQALDSGSELSDALTRVLAAPMDPDFDLGVALRDFMGNGTLVDLRTT